MDSIFNFITNFLNYSVHKGTNVNITVGTFVFAILIFLFTYIILKIVKKAIVKFFSITDNGRLETVFNFLSYFIYVIVLFSILSGIGININMFLTASAALFVGLGFALQQIFQDLIAGIYILLDRTLSVGDIIYIEDKVARVNVINLRSTLVETRDRRILVIPNRIFINDIIHNWTQDEKIIRGKVEVGVYIGTDILLVKKILLQSVETVDRVLPYPEPSVIIDDFGESSIRFHLRYYTDDAYNNDVVASDVRFEIDRLFRENSIKLPVPVLKLDKEASIIS